MGLDRARWYCCSELVAALAPTTKGAGAGAELLVADPEGQLAELGLGLGGVSVGAVVLRGLRQVGDRDDLLAALRALAAGRCLRPAR